MTNIPSLNVSIITFVSHTDSNNSHLIITTKILMSLLYLGIVAPLRVTVRMSAEA